MKKAEIEKIKENAREFQRKTNEIVKEARMLFSLPLRTAEVQER